MVACAVTRNDLKKDTSIQSHFDHVISFFCLAGGVFANSLALQTDAAHLASDLIAFLVSLFAIWAAGKPATKKMSFGFHRIEVRQRRRHLEWYLSKDLCFR